MAESDLRPTDLTGRVAIVTGAGGGIGRADARALAAQGACVVVNDVARDDDGTSWAQATVDLVTAAGGRAVANHSDISTFDGCEELVATAVASFGGLDIVVNNAGLYRVGHLEDIPEKEWDQVLGVNLKGTYGTIRFAAPIFKSQRSGVIVNTASGSGLGLAGQLAYSASKEAVVAVTRSVARELGHYGVRCNAIRPSSTGTTMFAQSQGQLSEWNVLRAAQGRHAMGAPFPGDMRLAVPENVGAFVAWLSSDAAAHVNGRTFMVGGEIVGLFSEPEVQRLAYHGGGWTPEALEMVGGGAVTAGLENHFLLPGFLDS